MSDPKPKSFADVSGTFADKSGCFNSAEDTVNHPSHYNAIDGIECIDVARHFSFNLGCVLKYIWRCHHKGTLIEDLRKAQFYLADEIERIEKEGK